MMTEGTALSPYRIKNWKKFQHFRNRRPPWIKLYRDLLDDDEYWKLPGDAARILTLLWLIASEYDGSLPPIPKLAFRLRTTEKAISALLPKLYHWIEPVDAGVISPGHQDDPPEKEKKKTVEKEPFKIPLGVNIEVWEAFEEHRKKLRKPMTDHARDLIVKELEKLGGDPNALLDQSIRKGWQDVFPLKETVPLPASVTELIDKKPEHLCIFDGCDKIGIIGRGKRMYCRKHNPAEPGNPF
jgi:hypothetical protein